MYSSGELFMRSREDYVGVYFPRCAATNHMEDRDKIQRKFWLMAVVMHARAQKAPHHRMMDNNMIYNIAI